MILYRDGKPFYPDPFNPERLVPVRARNPMCTFATTGLGGVLKLVDNINFGRDQTTRNSASGTGHEPNKVYVIHVTDTDQYIGGFQAFNKASTWARMAGIVKYNIETAEGE